VHRRRVIGFLGSVALWSHAAQAQQPKTHRIGVLALTKADELSFRNELREGLRVLGYAEGQTYLVEARSADENAARLPELAAELVRLRVDVLAAIFTPCALAAKQATATIPIVIVSVGDPVGSGLVSNLARPEGNITGLSNMGPETAGIKNKLSLVSALAIAVATIARAGCTRRIAQCGHAHQQYGARA
jgi:putative ABC transport system substrate-binding protein